MASALPIRERAAPSTSEVLVAAPLTSSSPRAARRSSSSSTRAAALASPGLYTVPMRLASGSIRWSRSRCFSIGSISLTPVMLAPGASQLLTSLAETGSVTAEKMTGISLGTFMHDTQVFTDAVTTLGQFVDNTLMGSIQCRVLNNLGDGNYTSVFCLNQACGGEQRRADQGTQSFLGHMPISGSVAGFPLERGGKRSKFGSLPQGYGVRDRVCSELCWLSLLNILNCR